MLRINQLRLPISHTEEELVLKVQKLLRCKEVPQIAIVRRSIDARKKPELYFNYILNITVENQDEVFRKCNRDQVIIWEETEYNFPVKNYLGKERPVIIGMGPAGLFCAYMLAEAGFKPIVLEQGKCVEERTEDVKQFWEKGTLIPESNVQFGEGGAGTFSDGKLNTLVKDTSGRNKKVLNIFVEAGAQRDILYDHKPHMGTDVLCKVITNIRNHILECGGEIKFSAKVTGFETKQNHITAVIVNHDLKIPASFVVLAPGHSARDTFEVLQQMNICMEPKPFAVGMRVEHPQTLINQSQYGMSANQILGNAPYKLTAKSRDGRGVYSFCMCPGGYVVNASSEPGKLAVNGMSYSGRDSQNANSAIIISVNPEDYGGSDPLAGVAFQRKLEKKAYNVLKGKIPVEKYKDYREACGETENILKKKYIPEDFEPCMKGEWAFGSVHEILPDCLRKAFIEGMEQFGKKIPGFNDPNTLIEGLESRTSSPVRIVRGDNLQASLKGLYPCGEGAGYAGGITSAAMDGIKVAEAVAAAIVHLQ